jgi:HNH endonuclease
MSHCPRKLRKLVIRRAANRCEYCGLSQAGQEATFHIDHVIPQASAGPTTAENLALACVSCSLRKAARQLANDPVSGQEAPLFNPRQDAWVTHFRWLGVCVEGLTPTGRATVEALRLNRLAILVIRKQEIEAGRLPQPQE